MPGTMDKALSYRRTQWLKSAKEGRHLEEIMRKSYAKLNKAHKRTIERDAKHFRCGKPQEISSGGLLLHFTADRPGEFAAVVRYIEDEDDDVATDTMQALENSEFLDSEAFVLIVGDDVFICVSRLREQALRFLLAKTVEKAGFTNAAASFELRAAANVEKIEMIHREGVAEIDLRISMFSASHKLALRTQTTGGVKKGISKLFQALGGYEEEEEDDNLIINVALKQDGRLKTGIASGSARIDSIAEQIIETSDDDDDFKIKTHSGARISQSEIYIKGTASIEKSGNALVRKSAWAELTSFYERLRENGSLER